MKQNKYSIIVPVYNGEKYLDRCIDSIINQKYRNIELILVNDGSIDNSSDICKKYARYDDRIIYIEQKNLGVSYARNKGIEEATGDYITFVDCDDYIDKDTLKILNMKIEKEKCDIIKYGYVKESKFVKKAYNFSIETNIKIIQKEYNEKVFPYIFKTYDLSNIWNAIYKKEVISDLRFDENLKYGEDFKFMIQALLESKSLYIYSECLYHYVYNSNSVINSKNIDSNRQRLIDVINCCLDIQKKLNSYIDIQEEFDKRIKNSIMVFCAEIANKNSYNNYIEKLKSIIENSKFENIEKRYYEIFNLNIWDNVFNYDYYKKLKKYNVNIKIKKFILKIIGGKI